MQCFAQMCTLEQPKNERYTQIYADIHPPLQVRGKCIYVMYVYDCNAIITTSMKNRSYKDMIIAFT